MTSSSTEMDPELARQLFFEGATIVIFGVPEGSEFGIDANSWQVGPRFQGVKMVPPGVHFIHYSAKRIGGTPEETGPRSGMFFHLEQKEIRLLRWDPQEEEMVAASQEEAENLREQLTSLDPSLGPYPYESLRRWVSLTNHISKETVLKLQPVCGTICSFPEVLPMEKMTLTEDRVKHNLPRYDTMCQNYKEGLSRLPQMKQKDGTEIRFSQLPEKMYPKNATPAEITEHSMDLSYALGQVIDMNYPGNPLEILAELQFAFVCFLLGNVYEGFEQWKNLLNLLCRAETFSLQHSGLYNEVISILYHQLAQVPTDFFIDIVSQNNFLTSTLQALFSFLCSPSTPKDLRKKALRFRSHLTKRFQWDFEEDPLDSAPLVVQLPEGWENTINTDQTVHPEGNTEISSPS
ncbi:protein AAR2 homolog [Hyla sarda]|uniref:protein AAR2 homolog n=1 Tax=Hyla sarda TaxID=327740 RepID=UPI0024C4470A|nr:protein AAR2 homolog [Hyla sarda]XP_056405938.1 protein AAR2 homolog [Hyla sarda]